MSSYLYPVPCALVSTNEGDCITPDALAYVAFVYPSYPSLGFIVDTRGLRVLILGIYITNMKAWALAMN